MILQTPIDIKLQVILHTHTHFFFSLVNAENLLDINCFLFKFTNRPRAADFRRRQFWKIVSQKKEIQICFFKCNYEKIIQFQNFLTEPFFDFKLSIFPNFESRKTFLSWQLLHSKTLTIKYTFMTILKLDEIEKLLKFLNLLRNRKKLL